MAKAPFNLASMGIEALIKLRDDIGTMLGHKTSELKRQLQRLEAGSFGATRGRGARGGRSLKGGKLPPKYRDTQDPSQVWAGRGARPRWMEERTRSGAKQEDFLIAGAGAQRLPASARRPSGVAARRRPPEASPGQLRRALGFATARGGLSSVFSKVGRTRACSRFRAGGHSGLRSGTAGRHRGRCGFACPSCAVDRALDRVTLQAGAISRESWKRTCCPYPTGDWPPAVRWRRGHRNAIRRIPGRSILLQKCDHRSPPAAVRR